MPNITQTQESHFKVLTNLVQDIQELSFLAEDQKTWLGSQLEQIEQIGARCVTGFLYHHTKGAQRITVELDEGIEADHINICLEYHEKTIHIDYADEAGISLSEEQFVEFCQRYAERFQFYKIYAERFNNALDWFYDEVLKEDRW